jgi:Ca2+-binding EF-hand superfamily protein
MSSPRGGRAINDVSVELEKEGPRGGGDDAFDLRGAFGAGDGGGKAAANATRVRSICASLGHDLDVVALSEAMRAMDPDDTGVVEYPAFARWWNADVETRGGGEDGASA